MRRSIYLLSALTWTALLAGFGCVPVHAPLAFPEAPLSRSHDAWWYDTNHDGKADFGLLRDQTGRFNVLAYDPDQDGHPDRLYRLSDYQNGDVPHLVILLDSTPYQAVVDRYARGDFNWFDPPQKVIPPFPSLSEQIYSRILGAPPLHGPIDNAYDPDQDRIESGVWDRVMGYHQPWEYRCAYVAKYYEAAMSYIEPRPWFDVELDRVHRVFERSPDRVTIVYLVSTSGMLCRLGQRGLDETLDGIQRLCLQLLWERHGAIKISICADHGHNLMSSKNIQAELKQALRDCGFTPANHLRHPEDVVINLDGLITYVGLYTMRPAAAAAAVLRRPEVELTSYLDRDHVTVQDHRGTAMIECRDGRYRYTALTADVLDLAPAVDQLRAEGKLDADGFIADADWFTATVDAHFPDAPHRLWAAFHEDTISPPDVMVTIRDGYCCGTPSLEYVIHMASTHGGLNQVNSATFLLSMTGRANRPLRSRDILPTIEPGYTVPVRPPK